MKIEDCKKYMLVEITQGMFAGCKAWIDFVNLKEGKVYISFPLSFPADILEPTKE